MSGLQTPVTASRSTLAALRRRRLTGVSLSAKASALTNSK